MQACLWTGNTVRNGAFCADCASKCVVFANTSDILSGAMLKTQQATSCTMLGSLIVQMGSSVSMDNGDMGMKDMVRWFACCPCSPPRPFMPVNIKKCEI
jgi:hypothetical protein